MDFILSLFKDKDSKDETQRQSLQDDLSKSFPAENIRVLVSITVYKDGGRLLYDSLSPPNKTPKPPTPANPSAPRKSVIPKNQDMYGDLMLGAVPLAQDGMITKVHHQQEINTLMLSKMFCIITRRKVASAQMDDDDDVEERRKSAERAKSMPVTSSGNSAATTTPPRPTSVSASAYSVKPQRTTYALGVVFTYSNPNQFAMLHTHFPLIDMRLKKMVRTLKNSLEHRITSSSFSHGSQQLMRAADPRRGSVIITQIDELQQAIASFQQAVQLLFVAPRLEYPIWSAVSTATKGRVQAYTLFLNSLKSLDTWDAGSGFLPTLITGLLTINLSWIRFLDLSELYIPDEAKKYLNKDRSVTSSHQNPMMWQLEDLFGFFGTKQHISRTIILSEKGNSCLNDSLLVLSYFLRCTQVAYPSIADCPGKLYPPSPPPPSSSSSDNNEFSSLSSSSSAIPSSPISIPTRISSPSPSSTPHPPSSVASSHQSSAASSHKSNTGNIPDYSSTINDPTASWCGANAAGFADNALPFSQNFSFSLYSRLYPGYLPDMALSATNLTREAVIPQVLSDMHTWMDHAPFSTKVLSASCILANLTSRKCEVLTYCPSPSISPPDELVQTLDSAWFSSVPKTVNREVTTESIERSDYITSTLASVRELWALGMPPEACVMFLEDKLRNVYIRCLSLLKHLQMLPCPSRLTFSEAADLIGCGTATSDIHLFVSVVEGVLPPNSFQISTLKEIGNWWLCVEKIPPPPATTSGSDSASAIHV